MPTQATVRQYLPRRSIRGLRHYLSQRGETIYRIQERDRQVNTTTLEIPDKVTEYVRAVITCEEIHEPHKARATQVLREMWLDLNASPFYPPTGLDWAEIVADWQGDYVHDPAMTTAQILDTVREVANTYLDQWETGECVACNSGAWVNHEGKCSDCDGSH